MIRLVLIPTAFCFSFFLGCRSRTASEVKGLTIQGKDGVYHDTDPKNLKFPIFTDVEGVKQATIFFIGKEGEPGNFVFQDQDKKLRKIAVKTTFLDKPIEVIFFARMQSQVSSNDTTEIVARVPFLSSKTGKPYKHILAYNSVASSPVGREMLLCEQDDTCNTLIDVRAEAPQISIEFKNLEEKDVFSFIKAQYRGFYLDVGCRIENHASIMKRPNIANAGFLLVESVEKGSVAQESGVEPGTFIKQMNDKSLVIKDTTQPGFEDSYGDLLDTELDQAEIRLGLVKSKIWPLQNIFKDLPKSQTGNEEVITKTLKRK